MKRPNPCIKEHYVPIEDAIRHVLSIKQGERIPPGLQARFRTILSRTKDTREWEEWYFKVDNEERLVRYEHCKFHHETITCVHLGDFINWHEFYETQLARTRVLCELLRLESHAVEVFLKHGYDGVVNEDGIFQSGSEYDKNKFLIFARKIESNENAADEDIVAARIALALPALWADYQSSLPNPWMLSSRLLIYSSAVPDPRGAERLLAEKDAEIKGMFPDYERGKKVLKGVLHAHEVAYGTQEEKEERWAGYLKKCKQTKNEYPHWKLTAVRQEVAYDEGVSLKTIERHTKELGAYFKEFDK